ncbi:hypothetical protein [Thermodesulforhabdus norvegica]|uniref:Lipoprotein n=1 Tax=Thermodesulforhabdus norvegica TaxID=39841 RepID=A0A1I4QTV2_9BACT|nr:hypothetical protein [Thermodesulforhabdus norvegica]SFM43437.1 hypothetical protein SAMN05660836_00219 [Thermodesulforhabdus norvegica]
MNRFVKFAVLSIVLVFLLAACGEGPTSTLEKLKKELDRYPEFSVILADMKDEGLFFKEYYHLYHIVYLENNPDNPERPKVFQKVSPWYRVDEVLYYKYRPCLGMTILSKKKDGTISDVPEPPGYQFVGDTRFGRWVTDPSGHRIWEWFAGYLILSTLAETTGEIVEEAIKSRHRIRYEDWSTYTVYSKRGRPYYGPRDPQGRPTYGTRGSYTQTKYGDSFFKRQQARMAARKSSFEQKVTSRYGRTRSSAFSRSSFRGK